MNFLNGELQVTEIIDCPQMPDDENEKFGIRIGWSNLKSGLQALQLGKIYSSSLKIRNSRSR